MAVQRLTLYAVLGAASAVLFFVSAGSARAQQHSSLNRSASPDATAGKMVDSLFEPKAPASLVPGNAPRKLQPRRALNRARIQGKLVRNPNTRAGAPPFALVDQYGGVLRYVEPVEKISLDRYLGKTVGVKHDTGDILLASQLTLPPATAARNRAPSAVQQAAFQEAIPTGKPAEETLLEPTPADSSTPALESGETYSMEGVPYSEGGPVPMGEGEMIYGEEGLNFSDCPDCVNGSCQLHGGMRPAGGGGLGKRAYLHGEYLLWWFDGMNTPPLVTTSTNPAHGGVLPNPGLNDNQTTSILYGGQPILEDPRHGFRVKLGMWMDDCNKQAIEVDYLFLGKLEETFTAGGTEGNPIISRPFFDFLPPGGGNPQENAEEVSSADLNGDITVYSSSEFQGAGISLRHNLCRSGCNNVGCGSCVDCGLGVDCGCGPIGCGSGCESGCGDSRFVDVLAGFRWYQLRERLQINEDLIIDIEDTQDPRFIDNGKNILVEDRFATDNDFLGGELGYIWGIERSRWSADLLTRIAIGSNRQRVSIHGDTDVFLANGNPDPDPNFDGDSDGGLLALSSNIGDYERDRFSMIPEVNLTLGYKVTQNLKLRAGYTLLYWTNVVRPGDQIDREINSTLLPGETPSLPPLRPLFTFNETNLLVQGLNIGGEYSW